MKELVDKIISFGSCSNCGGHYKMDGTCFYCNSKNEELANLLLEVKNAMNKNENVNGLNNIDNQLFRLRSFEEIDIYLKRKKYYELLENKENDLINKINNSSSLSLDDADTQFLQYLSVNSLNINNKIAFGLYIIISNYTGKNKYQKSDFVEVVKSTFFELMKKYTNNPNLIISDIKPEKCGETLGFQQFKKYNKTNRGTITISILQLDKLYSGKSIIPLQTFFHEHFHLIQESSLKENGLFNRYALNEIEDFVLSKYLPKDEYYILNYDVLSFENDAQVVSILNVLELLKRFNIQLKEEDSRQMISDYQYANDKLERTQIRIYQGKEYDLDTLFDDFMKTTDKADEIIHTYPQLEKVYIKKDGKYYRIPQEEKAKI